MDFQETSLEEILEGARIYLSSQKPSEWYEQNMVMPRGSAFPGPFKFDLTPYWKEPLDCFSKDHPAKEISIMKGAQLGGTVAVLNPVVGYTISQNPGNIMFLTGHSDLSKDAVVKIDYMIDNCGLRHLIRPNILRAKNSRTGDTNTNKEFSGGDFKSGSVTNHNLLRQHDVMIMIVDDYDAAPAFSKEAGATRELVQKRTSAFAHKKKIGWCSSPQLKGTSNIEEVFMLGDQRYYNVPCPCCHEKIILKWSVPIDNKETGGITYKVDNFGTVIRSSVGYVCQKCAGFFNDSHKYEMNINGLWIPTAQAKEEDHYSYQISSLYAPPGMDDWAHYATQYEAANPPGEKRKEKKQQTFVNVVLGETYEPTGDSLKATDLQDNNIRNYPIGIVPETLSEKDGNGKIVLLTCACDLNGKLDDARLDYEVVAWSETGSSYSVTHGSIGTFIPNESNKKVKEVREKWTYENNKVNNVWKEFSEILDKDYLTDGDKPRKMGIFITAMDTGFCELEAYTYIDNCNFNIIGVKGADKEDKYVKAGVELPNFKKGASRSNLYLIRVGQVKDDLSHLIRLKWDQGNDPTQPAGYMNYPIPSDGKYLYKNFFSHYEAEHKIIDKDNNFIWQKKSNHLQNHLFDCRVYNIAIKEIYVHLIFKELKIPNYTWTDYVNLLYPKK